MVRCDVNVSYIHTCSVEDLCLKKIRKGQCDLGDFASDTSQSSQHLVHLILCYLEYGYAEEIMRWMSA